MSAVGEEKSGFLGRVGSLFRRGSQEEPPFNDEQLGIIARLQEAEEARMKVDAVVEENVLSSFPVPQCHLPMGMKSGSRRPVLSVEDIRGKAPQVTQIDFVQVIDPMMVEPLIAEREQQTGIRLDESTINAERAMDATLDKSIPRLYRELDCAIKRKKEYASKRVHWEWAEEIRGQGKNAGRVDRTLKKVKDAVVAQQQIAIDKAFAEKRKAEAKMAKAQESLRKAAEDEQRARSAAQ